MKRRPAVGTSKPAIIRSKVVLPQPDAPRIENISPRWMSRFTESTATKSPKCLLTSLIWMTGPPGRRSFCAAAVICCLAFATTSDTTLDPGPGARAEPLLFWLGRQHREQEFPRLLVRINSRIADHRRIQQRRGRFIGVRVKNVIGDGGD